MRQKQKMHHLKNLLKFEKYEKITEKSVKTLQKVILKLFEIFNKIPCKTYDETLKFTNFRKMLQNQV